MKTNDEAEMKKNVFEYIFLIVQLRLCFSTFFDSQHPFMIVEIFVGNPSFDLQVNVFVKLRNSATPLWLFKALKG
jgi:hypothetical protein